MKHFGDLRGILHYVPQFGGRIFVVALDGGVIASNNFTNILLDLAVLHSLNIRIVLVHGAGFQAAKQAQERNFEPSDTEGIGPTDAETLQVSIDAVSRLTSDVMRDLTGLGMRTALTNALIARPAGVVGGVDLLNTGKIERVDATGLKTFLDQGMIPLVPPLGYDGKGKTLRLNSDTCAVDVAIALGAAKIIYVCGDALGRNPKQVPAEDAAELAAGGGAGSDGFRSKLREAARACAGGVSRVHLIDGSLTEGLLEELFSNEGVGTMVYMDDYQQIRAATEGDVAEILSLINQSVEAEELVQRTRRDILDKLDDYLVLEVDGNVVGTVALHVEEGGELAEVACLFIKRTHEGRGYGRRLISHVEKSARRHGVGMLYALSTQAYDFFEKKTAFKSAGISVLPEARRKRFQSSGRNSKILVKDLGGQ